MVIQCIKYLFWYKFGGYTKTTDLKFNKVLDTMNAVISTGLFKYTPAELMDDSYRLGVYCTAPASMTDRMFNELVDQICDTIGTDNITSKRINHAASHFAAMYLREGKYTINGYQIMWNLLPVESDQST